MLASIHRELDGPGGGPAGWPGSAPALAGHAGPYDRRWVPGDVVAGLTVWAVLVPEALAYATIAGVSPVVGLYAAAPALVLYAAFGSSRHLVIGPMSATAALSAATVAEFAAPTGDDFAALTATLALVTGVALAGRPRAAGLLGQPSSRSPCSRASSSGWRSRSSSASCPKLFGVEKGDGQLLRASLGPARQPGRHDGHDAGGRRARRWCSCLPCAGWRPLVPGSLVAVLLRSAGRQRCSISTSTGSPSSGPIDSGLPAVGRPTSTSATTWTWSARRVGVMLVGFAEGLGAAKTYAARDHYEIDADRELLGLGAANLGSGLVSGMVVNGSLSKTAVNGAAGARSQLSGLVVRGADGGHPAVPDRSVRGASRGDAGGRRDRGGDRARRHRRAARPATGCTPRTLGAHLRRGGAARLHRRDDRDARRARLRHAAWAVHRDRDLAAAAALPGVAPARRGARPGAGEPRPVRGRERHPENERVPASWSCGSRAASSSPTPSRARVVRARAGDGVRAIVLDAETVPFVDVDRRAHAGRAGRRSRPHGRRARHRPRHRPGRRRRPPREPRRRAPRTYPTVRAAVDALAGPESPGQG